MSPSCPCGSARLFGACCGPYLTKESPAPTAEALMRSRYCAFVRHDWEYLNETQKVRDNDPPTADIEWLGLEVLGTQAGGADDLEGSVEFIAHYRHHDRPGTLHEISRFSKQEGNWVYIDGEFPSIDPA